MDKGRIIFFATRLVLLLFLVVPYTAIAGVPAAKDLDSVRLKKEELLCRQIQDKIKKNQELRKTVKTSIQLGYDACAVIKCAIKGGGDLKQIIPGATDAGSTKDVVSKCSLDAGAAAKDVAAILSSLSEPGICYILPEEPEIITGPPSGTSGGFLLSPGGFSSASTSSCVVSGYHFRVQLNPKTAIEWCTHGHKCLQSLFTHIIHKFHTNRRKIRLEIVKHPSQRTGHA